VFVTYGKNEITIKWSSLTKKIRKNLHHSGFDENGSGTISVNAGGSSASARTNSRLISSFFRESMRHNNRLYQNSAKLTSTNINNNNNNRDNINNINNNNNNVENLSFSSTESLTESSVKDEEEEVVVVLDYPSGVI